MSDKREITTVYGNIEVETVRCDSCDQEVPKQEAKRWVMGDVQSEKAWRLLGKYKYEFKTGSITTGWACEYCRDEGIAALPDSSLLHRMVQNPVAGALAFLALVWSVTVAFAVIGAVI